MLKRNEGYALSYVLVVLLVLCGIAIAVMSISLHNLKNQQASIDRMVDKYAAQGMVEQVVAQLENSKTPDTVVNDALSYDNLTGIYTIELSPPSENINAPTIKCTFTLTSIKKEVDGVEPDEVIGHKVEYLSYDVSYTSPNEGGSE